MSGPMYLGEEGTEQFTVETVVDGKTIRKQPIHDPFIRTTVVQCISRWDLFKALFQKQFSVKVQVIVDGSEGANRAIMTMDPHKLQADSEEILEQRKFARENSPTTGLYYATENK